MPIRWSFVKSGFLGFLGLGVLGVLTIENDKSSNKFDKFSSKFDEKEDKKDEFNDIKNARVLRKSMIKMRARRGVVESSIIVGVVVAITP